MQSVGQAWLVLELTNSPFRLGMIGSLQFGPMLLFSFVAGAVSDRVRKRRLILGTQTVLMLQALALAVLVASGHVQVLARRRPRHRLRHRQYVRHAGAPGVRR